MPATVTITPRRNPYRMRTEYHVQTGATVIRCDTADAAQAEADRLVALGAVQVAPMRIVGMEPAGRMAR